ncbi:MAG: hypothetical protein COY81_03310 [Candidatus Pacebacteria bacterium CG_4_10_14_0_8_um_filter_43_12]|nr:MAG: hypothetical protein COY81_03310 [Candidatus Pacebacteria bacterium CG_4_10_14_0_8_um_filter_43_12]
MSKISRIPVHIGWYVSGFTDGEGSFNISFRKKSDYKHQWQPILSFNISQKDITVLSLIKQYFDCGIIKQRKDGLFSYDVTIPTALDEIVVPFFKTFPFFSKNKQENFYLFSEAVKLMVNKDHLNLDGLKKLVEIREKINKGKGRKRKYTKKNMFLESSETIR